MSLLDALNEQNHRIVVDEMDNHDKHYRCLCHWVDREIKRRGGRYYKRTGEAMIGDILCQGHTVASCMWERYKPQEVTK